MTKFLHLLATATVPALALAIALPATAAIKPRTQKSDVFKYAPVSKYEQTHGGKALSYDNVKANIESKNQSAARKAKTLTEEDIPTRLPSSYTIGYLDAPDGSLWYYTKNLTYTEVELEGGYATDKYITGYTFTIYNDKYEEIGSFSDTVEPNESETRISDIQIGACVTQKFFNTDSNYEVMVMIAANTAAYVNNYRTRVYSLGNSDNGAIAELDDYYSDAINVGTYSEKYYITFVHEGNVPALTVDGYADMGYDIVDEVYVIRETVYGPASWSSATQSVLKTFTIPYTYVEGSGGLPFLSTANGSAAYFAVVQFEKPFYASTGISYNEESGELERNTVPTNDNSLIINLYKTTYSGLELYKTTKIPMKDSEEDGTLSYFYELGYLNYNDDVTFDTWTKDGNPAYVITVENYATGTDSSTYDFEVYNVDGQKIADIEKDVTSLVDVSDLPGFEHQQGFYKLIDDVEYFEYVDMPSCNVAATFAVQLDDNSLTAISDRYPKGDTYQYAFSLSTGMNNDDNSNTDHYIAWFNKDGKFDHNDIVPLGANIAMAYPYIKTSTLNPYLFNTDDKTEYMFLLKTYLMPDISTATSESLAILNSDGTAIARLLGDDDLGYLVNIVLVDAKGSPTLWLSYYNDDTDLYTSAFLPLPLSKFEQGGDGSSSNPYLIATAGDLQQIKSNLSANYKIVNDIDAEKCMFVPIAGEFTGTLDGANHTIKNFSLSSDQYYNGIFQEVTNSASIKNINFENVNVTLTADNDASGLIASQMRGSGTKAPSIDNVHVDGYTVTVSDDNTGCFGGLVGNMYLNASLTNSSITNASFDLGTDNVGGLVAETRTGSKITNCAFDGWIAGGTTVGGLLAKATTGDETINNNHVSAYIEGANTIGGLIGDAARAKISNNVVASSMSASTVDKWGHGPMIGGIVGRLEEDWTKSSTAILSNNVALAYTILTPTITEAEEWLNQTTTAHRIAGYTIFNAEPGTNGKALDADAGLSNNYAISSLSSIDSNIEAAANTTEGASISAAELTQTFLAEELGFAFGNNSSSPWKIVDGVPYLYYEDASKSSVEDVISDTVKLESNGTGFSAEGCTISVYNLAGVKVAEAANSLSTLTLAKGVYVVTAAQKGKVTATAKFSIR